MVERLSLISAAIRVERLGSVVDKRDGRDDRWDDDIDA
jgi:hypothetical protein